MKPTECACIHTAGEDLSKPAAPLNVASYVLPVFDGQNLHGETCIGIHPGARYIDGPIRFTPAQARALAAALVAHADYVDRVLAAVAAVENPPKVEAPIAPETSTADLDFEDRNRAEPATPAAKAALKVGDLVRFVDIPIGAKYVFTEVASPAERTRTATGGREVGRLTEISARLHTPSPDYRITALPSQAAE